MPSMASAIAPLRSASRAGLRVGFISRHIRFSSQWTQGPSPPRLPKEEQEIFEELQKRSTGAFSTPRSENDLNPADLLKRINQSPQVEASSSGNAQPRDDTNVGTKVSEEEDELHPHVRKGAAPEFEGDVNPKTGEVGGPKNEPLRWGAKSDWSFNGRVTDF